MECELSDREGRRYEKLLILPHFSNPTSNLKYHFTEFHSPWLLQEVVWGLVAPAILTKFHELKCVSALTTYFFFLFEDFFKEGEKKNAYKAVNSGLDSLGGHCPRLLKLSWLV